MFWHAKKRKSQNLRNWFEKCATVSYLPLDFPYWTAFSSKWWYCGILEAAKSRDGLVVASVGLYCEMARMKKSRTVTRRSFLKIKTLLSYFQNRLNPRRQWWIFSTVPTWMPWFLDRCEGRCEEDCKIDCKVTLQSQAVNLSSGFTHKK